MSKNYITTALAIIVGVSSPHALTQPNYCRPDNPDGIQYLNEEKRLVSVSRVPVKFNDSSGRRKARVIAQERAKGEIVRFFQQNQTSFRQLRATDSDNETATRLVDHNGVSTRKEYTREQSDTLVEMETSIAAGNLSGIRQVEESFDSSTQEICVAMGLSSKSAQGAREVQSWMGAKDEKKPADVTRDREPSNQEAGSYTRAIKDDW